MISDERKGKGKVKEQAHRGADHARRVPPSAGWRAAAPG
jgi:hypothetical protein